MNLKAIVATATTEKEAELICSEIFKSLRPHAYVHFFKIDGYQVTVVYEPNTARFERMKKEAEAERAALPPVKKAAKQLTIEDLEAKVKKLGLDKDLFVRVVIRNPDKPQKYIIHDLDWNLHKPATFESKSAIAVSRKLTKIHKERQAAKIGHALVLDPSQPIDIQKVCPHCDRPMEKGETCCTELTLIDNKAATTDTTSDKPVFETYSDKPKTVKIKAKAAAKIPTSSDEWRKICDIGLTDIKKLEAILPTLHHDRNIEEVAAMITRLQKPPKRVLQKSPTVGTETEIYNIGNIAVVDNGPIVNYKIGEFSYLVDDCDVIVTKSQKRGLFTNIASYEYKTHEVAKNAALNMARRHKVVSPSEFH